MYSHISLFKSIMIELILFRLSNIAAKLSSDFQKACVDNIDKATELDKLLQPLHSALFIESNPSPVCL